MLTDPVPRSGKRRTDYERSDRMTVLAIPPDDALYLLALGIDSALNTGLCPPVRNACAAFLREAAGFYGVNPPEIRVLASRPIRVYEAGSSELFGDYDLKTALIRTWMRTAVQHRVTSFGTFTSTLCHEFCHHLDVRLFDLPGTPHTRGFYQRTAQLYHYCRGTPLRPLLWRSVMHGRYQIDWARMRAR